MTTTATYTLETPAAPAPAPTPEAAPGPSGEALAFLGFGLLRPFRRSHQDWAAAGGAALIQSAVGQILGTISDSEISTGEMPWRTEFGSVLYLLRHRQNSEALVELARNRVATALARWEPRVRVRGVRVGRESSPGLGQNRLVIRVRYDIIDRNRPGNQVLFSGLESAVPVQ